jgi:2-keto-4-pentenoate hydratase
MDRSNIAGPDKDRLYQAAEMLLEARRSLRPIDDLPAALRPKTLEEAYYVQDLMLDALGTTGGWKVGAPTADATPMFAPMPGENFAGSGGLIAKEMRRLRGVEAEIAFLLGKDLPPRSTPYTREEVLEAIASCHPAIELLESGLLNPDAAERLTAIADLQSNGGFIYGEAVNDWKNIDFAGESAQLNVDGFVRVTNGKNSAGSDLLRRAHWRLAGRAMDHHRQLDGQSADR